MDLSEDTQNRLVQFQQLQQQIQYLSMQRYQLEVQLKETEKALEALGAVKPKKGETGVYRSIGSLLVKVDDLAALKKELAERKESQELRVRTLERQEKHMRDQQQGLQGQLEKELSKAEGHAKKEK
jgi:prefoldin beta subunit